MKRVFVVVLALLGAMSLEAVSVSWTQLTSGTGDKAFALSDGFKAMESQVVTYAILIPQGLPSSSAFLLGVSGVNTEGSAAGNWNQAYLKAAAGGALSFSFKNNVDGTNDAPTSLSLGGASLSADKESLVAFTVDRGGKTITVYKDGVQLSTSGELSSLFNKDMVMLAYGQNFGGNETFALEYEVYAYAGAISAADATVAAVVPEPTGWALVVMGVAGVACAGNACKADPMQRRAFLRLLGAGVAGLAAKPSWGEAVAKRPNIVLFMVDDMGWQDTSQPFLFRHGKLVPTRLNRRYRTPNMERLAREGMLFTQAYACAVCSPTRCSLMSGMNAARHRVTDWTLGVNQQNRLTLSGEGLTPPRWAANGLQPAGTQPRGQCQPPWRSDSSGKYYQPSFGAAEGAVAYEMQLPYTCAKVFPALLRERGYYTIHCGKAHWGAGSSHYNEEASQAPTTPGADPRAFGFDENIAGSEIGGPANYRGDKRYGNGSGYVQFATPGLDENGYYERNVFQTDALADMALRSVERHVTAHPDQPFYLYFALYAIHAPLGDETTWDASRSASPDLALDTLNPNPNDGLAWNKVERNYGTLIKGMDDALGAVLDKLEALGVAENTLVLFMADNGGLSVSGRLAQANAPLRGGKGSCYEGGTREPLIVRWPGHIAAGSISHEPVMIEDFYPTLLEAAQVPLPEALAETPAGVYDDGALAQVIDGESFLPVLCAQRATVREDGQPRALLWHYPNQWGEGPAGRSYNFYSALRRGAWKLIYQHSDRSFELYDLEHDLSESRNLAVMRPEITQALRDEMGRLLRARRAQMPSVQASGERVPYPDEVPVPTLPAGITLQP